MNQMGPISFVICLTWKTKVNHLGEQETKAQRGYATCKGSHSTEGPEPSPDWPDWLPGQGSLSLLLFLMHAFHTTQ